MDEPTGGFDEHTEKLASKLLGERLKGRTIISIAPQVETGMDSDLVMFFNHGTVSEIGPRRELLSRKRMFSQLYLGEDIIEDSNPA
ncbi:hypothetical protein N7522_007226 [Penicillium canescens]|nr:hypothetical protein N7522_007226 [Penicillium canescens]